MNFKSYREKNVPVTEKRWRIHFFLIEKVDLIDTCSWKYLRHGILDEKKINFLKLPSTSSQLQLSEIDFWSVEIFFCERKKKFPYLRQLNLNCVSRCLIVTHLQKKIETEHQSVTGFRHFWHKKSMKANHWPKSVISFCNSSICSARS